MPAHAAAEDPTRVVPKQARSKADAWAVIPKPNERPSYLVGQVHLLAVFPLYTGGICPDESACVYGGGGGLLGSVETRFPFGLAIGGAYQLWLLHGHGVHEVSVQHGLGPLLRYVLPSASIVHPFVVAVPQILLFGDTFSVASIGGGVDLAFGVELELNESTSLVTQVGTRIFGTSAFTSASDKLQRAEGRDVEVAMMLHVGLQLAQIP